MLEALVLAFLASAICACASAYCFGKADGLAEARKLYSRSQPSTKD